VTSDRCGLSERSLRKFRLICKSATLILVWNGFSALATVYNSDGSAADVQRIHDTMAADGDTITLPSGSFDWSTTLTINKAITLIGQTTTDPINRIANDQTIVRVFTGTSGNTPLMRINAAGARLSSITFRTGQTSVVNSNGMVQLNGDLQRLDNCHFDDLSKENNNVASWGGLNKVIDHNIFDFRTAGTQSIFYAQSGAYWGDEAWTQPAGLGSANFVFVEDNCFNGHGFGGGLDDRQGGRIVIRHNHFYDMDGAIGSHGTEIGRYRGGRAQEVYNNDFHYTIHTSGIGGIRSGAFIKHDNTYDGIKPDHDYSVGQYRVFFPVPVFGGSTGDNPWDYNVTEPDGSHIDGHPPYLFQSGAATTGTGTFNGQESHIVDATKNWTPNQWVGYTVKRVSDNGMTLISSNTNNTLIGYWHSGYGGGTLWNSGDQYQIHKVLISQDQATRGQGDLITGDSTHPVNATTGTPSWTHQVVEPAYSWNDVYTPTGVPVNIELAQGAWAVLQQGREYFNNTPMPGYTPYPYPHPLTVDGSPSPTPSSSPSASQSPTPSSTPTPTATATATPRHTPKPHPSHAPG